MDLDPIDGGPREVALPPVAKTSGMGVVSSTAGNSQALAINKEEEARQCIDMLRGDDLSARVAAAHRLDSVASVLGEERTREVGYIGFGF